ncbi:MAG: nucleotidyltransferase family protein [Lentisphaerae bacterium]|nr:nucleotidyltransferase family protein [Lentisphaerota bacterium]
MTGAADNRAVCGKCACELQHVLAAAITDSVVEQRPDWSTLLPLAIQQQLDPFLFDAIIKWPLHLQPDAVDREHWERQQRQRVVTAVRRDEQLAQILEALKRAGVPTVTLKGAWLAEHVYGDITQRPMSDHDLMIRPADAQRAVVALREIGYETTDNSEPGGWSKGVVLKHRQWLHGLELQWSLWHESHHLPQQRFDSLWECIEPTVVAGVEAFALPLSVHLAYLAYHIMAHQWRVPIRSHLDVVLFLRRYAGELEGEVVNAEARRWGLNYSIPFSWWVSHGVCGVKTPEVIAAVEESAGEGHMDKLVAMALQMPHREVVLSRLLGQYHKAAWWQRGGLVLRALLAAPAKIRHDFPQAVRWGGLVGGYLARGVDLIRRRRRDLMPADGRQAAVQAAADDMEQRLNIETWLRQQDVELREKGEGGSNR